MMQTHDAIPPFYQADSEILILGSFPSVRSRHIGFYYGHKSNRFWKIVPEILQSNSLIDADLQEKQRFLQLHRIALYDVVQSCEIVGSSDASLTCLEPANLDPILQACPIRKILLNGKRAAQLFDRYFQMPALSIYRLPSTSSANLHFDVEAWRTALTQE